MDRTHHPVDGDVVPCKDAVPARGLGFSRHLDVVVDRSEGSDNFKPHRTPPSRVSVPHTGLNRLMAPHLSICGSPLGQSAWAIRAHVSLQCDLVHVKAVCRLWSLSAWTHDAPDVLQSWWSTTRNPSCGRPGDGPVRPTERGAQGVRARTDRGGGVHPRCRGSTCAGIQGPSLVRVQLLLESLTDESMGIAAFDLTSATNGRSPTMTYNEASSATRARPIRRQGCPAPIRRFASSTNSSAPGR